MSKRFYCAHKGDYGKDCPFACLDYENGHIVVVSRHKSRSMREGIRHVNEIPIAKILEAAVSDGEGAMMLKEILRLMGKDSLTEVFDVM